MDAPRRLLRRPSPATAIALVALFLALGGGQAVATAVKQISGSQIMSGTVTSKQVKDRSLLAADFKPGQLPAGVQGTAGKNGDPGAAGAKGDAGPAGPAGAKGDPGVKGDTGLQGLQGVQGATGTVDTANFYDKAASDGKYLLKTGVAADSSLLGGSSPTTFTRGQSTSVVGARDLISHGGGTVNRNLLSLDNFGSLEASCTGPPTASSLTFNKLSASVTDATLTVTANGTAPVVTQSSVGGSPLPLVTALAGPNTRAVHLQVSTSTQVTTFDISVVNQNAGGPQCLFAVTATTQSGIGTF